MATLSHPCNVQWGLIINRSNGAQAYGNPNSDECLIWCCLHNYRADFEHAGVARLAHHWRHVSSFS
jgi:hypothetical protein